MVNLLASATETINQITDAIGAKWPELLAILTSTAFVSYASAFLFKILGNAITSRSKKKHYVPILEEMKQVRNDILMLKKEIKQDLLEYKEETKQELKNNLNEINDKEAAAKKAFFDSLTAEPETKQIIEKVPEEIITLFEPQKQPVESENTTVEEIVIEAGKASQNEAVKLVEHKKTKKIIKRKLKHENGNKNFNF